MLERFRRLVESRRQQRVGDLRQRVATDADRARLAVTAVIVDARRIGAPVPVEVTASVVILAGWVDGLRAWALESEA
jgi:hypothetical protein